MDRITHFATGRLTIVAAIALAALCLIILPATGHASSSVVNNYNVKVAKGILANGDTVKAKAVITNGAAQQSSWWSQKSIASVVRTGVNRGYGKSYVSQGYRCTSSVQAWIGKFTCNLAGADVATVVKLTFAATWRH
ncbi:MAG TPA: hypothetical protein VH063_00880 [Gaiellaceae bacterium]|jgi:hypothetical protein|nr:hypothetical protein [Gaiellaceae bacterium]